LRPETSPAARDSAQPPFPPAAHPAVSPPTPPCLAPHPAPPSPLSFSRSLAPGPGMLASVLQNWPSFRPASRPGRNTVTLHHPTASILSLSSICSQLSLAPPPLNPVLHLT